MILSSRSNAHKDNNRKSVSLGQGHLRVPNQELLFNPIYTGHISLWESDFHSHNLYSCENLKALWNFLSSTYFCCQTAPVTEFKPWSAFAADSTIMAGKWPVTFFGGAWHFAYIRGIQEEKYVRNEVYGKSCNYTLHFIEYRSCLICETKAGEPVKAEKKSTYSHIFKGSCQLFFSIYKILMASDKMKNVPKCIIWPFFFIALMFKELNRWEPREHMFY